MLRGCRLRNTKDMIGIVAYVGHETKIMKNSIIGKPKKSDLEKITQKMILFVFLT